MDYDKKQEDSVFQTTITKRNSIKLINAKHQRN